MKSKISDDQIISYLKEGHGIKETASHLHVDNGRVGQLANTHGLKRTKKIQLSDEEKYKIQRCKSCRFYDSPDGNTICPECNHEDNDLFQQRCKSCRFYDSPDGNTICRECNRDYNDLFQASLPPPPQSSPGQNDIQAPPTDLEQHRLDNIQAFKNMMMRYLDDMQEDTAITYISMLKNQKIHVVANQYMQFARRNSKMIEALKEMVNNV